MTKLLSNNEAYLLKPGHDQLFREVREWRSDLEFYQTELAFLKKILDKAFLRITRNEEVEELDTYLEKIKTIDENELILLLNKAIAHENYLAEIDDDDFPGSDEMVWDKHDKLKPQIIKFINEMKILKLDIFSIVEKKIKRGNKASADYMDGNVAL